VNPRSDSFLIILVAATCALAIAACGSATSLSVSAASGTSNGTAQVAFASCMRAHGVPNFPDSAANINGPYNSIGGIAIPATINTQAPAFKTAIGFCHRLISAVLSRQGRPGITASRKASMIAHAQCMRTHGVPGFQDPTFPASGGISVTDAGTDPDSPAYKHASVVCGSR
jgi:hypothetical protein